MTDTKPAPISNLLLTLLLATKERHSDGPVFGKEFVAKALEDLYCTDMSFSDCLLLTVNAYEELQAEPRFQAGSNSLHELLLSPVKGHFSHLGFFNTKLNSTLTVEQIYDSLFKFMLSAIHLSAVGWCREDLNEYKAKMQLEKIARAERHTAAV